MHVILDEHNECYSRVIYAYFRFWCVFYSFLSSAGETNIPKDEDELFFTIFDGIFDHHVVNVLREFLHFFCVHFSVIRFDSLRTSFLIIFAKNMQKRTDYARSRQFAIVFLNFRRHPFLCFSIFGCFMCSHLIISFKCVSCYFYFVPKQRKLNVSLSV